MVANVYIQYVHCIIISCMVVEVKQEQLAIQLLHRVDMPKMVTNSNVKNQMADKLHDINF